MQITCPECHREFKVPAEALGTGRDVKCTFCLHVWFQKPPEDDMELAFIDAEEAPEESVDALEEAALDIDMVEEEPQPQPTEAPEVEHFDVPETLVEQDEKEHVVQIEEIAEEPEAKTQWRSAVLAFFFVFFLMSGAVLLFKQSLIKVWPSSVRFYQLIGVYHGSPLSDFKWEKMVSEIRLDPHNVPYLFVGADLRNLSKKELVIPHIYVELTENNQVIEEKILKIDAKKIAPDDVYSLKIGLSDFPDTAVTARLVLSEQVKKDKNKEVVSQTDTKHDGDKKK